MMKLLVSLCLILALIALTTSQTLGGFSEMDIESEEVKNVTNYAMPSIAQQTGTNNTFCLVKIKSAHSQVVSGTNYKIAMVACEQDSTKENQLINEACRSCIVTIWEQLWLNKINVTSVDCSKPGSLESVSAA